MTDFISRNELLNAGRPIEVGSHPSLKYRMVGSGVEEVHALIETNGETGYKIDLVAGQMFLNGNRIANRALVEPGDKIRFGDTLTWRVEKGGLRYDPAPSGMELELKNVSVQRGGRTIFEHVFCEIAADEFVGIIGPSGCGKSTLLEILSLTGGDFEGVINFDRSKNIQEHLSEYVKMFGYVPQDDILHGKLTVYDNLWYAARLRYKNTGNTKTAKKAITEAIDEALERVGLTEHRNDIVEKLSGGQRKRVSIAMELLKRPRLLILDEPTSGLDPATESRIMNQLKRIAKQGTTVLCTTHMMANVEDFDKIIAFGQTGVVTEQTRQTDSAITRLLKSKNVKTFAALYDKLRDDEIQKLVRARIVSEERNDEKSSALAYASCSDFLAGARIVDWLPFRQTWDVVFRCLQLFLASPSLVFLTFAQPLFLGVLAVLSQYDETGAVPLFFFSVVIAIWLGMNNSIRSIVAERRNFVRENLAGLSMNHYLCGKTVFYTLIGVVQLSILLGVVCGLTPIVCEEILYADFPRVMPWTFFGVLLLGYFSSLGLGLLVSTVSPSENIAVALLPPLIMLQILLSMVAAGNFSETSEDSRRIMPNVLNVSGAGSAESAGQARAANGYGHDISRRIFDLSSRCCYSRPALFVLYLESQNGPKEDVRGEYVHAVILCIITWIVLWLAFFGCQRIWRKVR